MTRIRWRLSSLLDANPISMAILFALILAATQVLRRTDCLLNSQFWAEDGSVFYSQQVSLGFWRALLTPFAGYLHTVPRLVALTASFVPTRWTPHAFAVSALLINGVAGSAFVWPCFRRLIASDWLRVCCCLVAGTAIYPGIELVATVCDIQWYLTPLFLLLVWLPPETEGRLRWQEVALTLSQMLIALSAPGTLLLLPLLVWQVVRRLSWRRWRPALTLAAMSIQVFLLYANRERHTPVGAGAMVLATVNAGVTRCVLSPMLGYRFLETTPERSLYVHMAFAFVAVIVLVTLVLVDERSRERRSAVSLSAALAPSAIALALAGRDLWMRFLNLQDLRFTAGERYWLLGGMLFIFIVSIALESASLKLGAPWSTLLPCLVLLLMFNPGIRRNFLGRPLQNLGWSGYAAQIDAWLSGRKAGRPVKPLIIPVNPPPFAIRLTP